jgi:hypothetical protein
MAECNESGDDKVKLFDDFKAMIAEAKLPTAMGK